MEDVEASLQRLMRLMDERRKRSNVIDLDAERKKRAAGVAGSRPQVSGPNVLGGSRPDREDR